MAMLPAWVFRAGTFEALPVASVLRPSTSMGYDADPTAGVRERRFQGLVSDLLPRVRRLNPTMPDDQVLEMAESMAELRLREDEVS